MALLNAETLGWTDYGVHSLISKGRLYDISVDPSDRVAGLQQCELNKDTIPCPTYNVTFSRNNTQKNCIQQTNGSILALWDSSFHITVKKIHDRNNLVGEWCVWCTVSEFSLIVAQKARTAAWFMVAGSQGWSSSHHSGSRNRGQDRVREQG